MRFLKYNPVFSLANHFVIDAPEPSNISYLWNFGSLLGVCLIVQILTGVFLAMHYNPSDILAFNSVESIMRDVNYGWLIRYFHANTASFFFICLYIHIGRGLYYSSYQYPRILPWIVGVIIFIVTMATAFLGYILPYGQMSYWGGTVITNLLSIIPWIGNDFVNFVWGGFSVNDATINRFFALHFLCPFIIAALSCIHLLTIHHNGSNNPLGITSTSDRLPFQPYFVFKDLVTIFVFIISIGYFVFYYPNYLGHSDNYIEANPMVTPISIVPEWYFLPFYAILRSIEWKFGGVIAMFGSLVILVFLPLLDISSIRGANYRPLFQFFFFLFVSNFFVLTFIGSQHVEAPFVNIGIFSTIFYFVYFIFIILFLIYLYEY